MMKYITLYSKFSTLDFTFDCMMMFVLILIFGLFGKTCSCSHVYDEISTPGENINFKRHKPKHKQISTLLLKKYVAGGNVCRKTI